MNKVEVENLKSAVVLFDLGKIAEQTKGIFPPQNFRENGSFPFCWRFDFQEPKGGTPCFP